MNKRIMEAMGFGKEVELAKKGYCPLCKQLVRFMDFRTATSVREHRLSGLCQSCQDDFFGTED